MLYIYIYSVAALEVPFVNCPPTGQSKECEGGMWHARQRESDTPPTRESILLTVAKIGIKESSFSHYDTNRGLSTETKHRKQPSW
jgi:hypothetical protein